MVRKASKLKQKQRQSQKQIVNITLAKEPKRKPVKRRSAGRASAQQQQNYTGGFTPVYIQSGNLAEQNINPLIKTIEELKESIKKKPVEKQLVMRTPMKPLEYETGFDFTEDKFENKVNFINEQPKQRFQSEIVKPAFVPESLQKAEANDTPFSLGISPTNLSINPAFSEPILTQAQIINQTGRGKGKGGGRGLLPIAKSEDEVNYENEKKKYNRAVNYRIKAQEKAQNEGKEYRPRKNLPPTPVRK